GAAEQLPICGRRQGRPQFQRYFPDDRQPDRHGHGYGHGNHHGQHAPISVFAGTPVQQGQSAGIGFWANKKGQALINSFNGGSPATALSAWLATTFSNMYGSNAGANNLTGQTNAQVAAFYQSLFNNSATKLDAEVLATALNVYATTSSLGGGPAATQDGFTVT